MNYLFLSYSKRDKNFAKTIKTILQKAGFAVWLDENPRELTAEQWPIIEENIRKAAAFVLLVSEGAKQSAWIKRELDFAESIQKPIFPVLIDGDAWSRLTMPVETLELGISLDLPDSLFLKLKELEPSPLPLELPPQIPTSSINYKRGRAKQSFLRWLGIMAAVIVFFLLLSPSFLSWLNYRLEENRLPQSSRIALTVEAERLAALDLTATANQIERNENQTERAYERSLTATEAIVLDAGATSTQQANLNLTATVGNGQLPCTATVVMVDNLARLVVYRYPSLMMGNSTLTATTGEEISLIVTEWITNSSGIWYRVGTEAQASIGFVRPESLVLDETCPR